MNEIAGRLYILALAAAIATVIAGTSRPSTHHGPPAYVVDIAAPPMTRSTAVHGPWASVSARAALGGATARVWRVCDAIARIKGDDLARDWRPVCAEIAARAPGYGVPSSVAVAVAWHESRFDADAIGALGEVGPLQVRPEIHCGGRCDDAIGAGLAVLARYITRHGVDADLCRYRGAPLNCESPRLALAREIEGGAP